MFTNSPIIAHRALATLLFLLPAMFADGEFRHWEDLQGNRFEAEFRHEIFGTVFLTTADRKKISIDVENLSEKDLQYVRTQIPPEVKIKVSKSEQKKILSIYAQPDDRVVIVTIDVEIEQTSRALFLGELTAEAYLISREVATDDRRLLVKEVHPVRFTEENDLDGFSLSAEVRHYLEYNKDFRGAKYEGYVVLVFDPQGRQIAWNTNLDWLEEENLSRLRELKPEWFFNKKCKKVRVPRPDYYIERGDWSQ